MTLHAVILHLTFLLIRILDQSKPSVGIPFGVKMEREDENNLVVFSFKIIEAIYTQIDISN